MEKMNLYNKINEFLGKNLILFLVFLIPCVLGTYNSKNIKNPITKEVAYKSRTLNTVSLDSAAPMSVNTRAIGIQNKQNGKKIVKNFNLSLIVKDIAAAKNKIEEQLDELKGYETNFYSYEYSNKKAINLELKIPSEKADEYLDFIKKIGYVKSENFSSTDYTEQYDDTENKLKNLYTRRNKLREMMKTQAKQLSDILAVDKELNNTQMEIERLEKQNNKIQKDVDYSSIYLILEPEIVENNQIQQWSFKATLINSFNLLINFCFSIFEYLILFFIFLPVVIISYCLFILIKKIYLSVKK